MTYTIARGGTREWPKREYTLEEILTRAIRDNRYVRDGYSRRRLRNARKLVVTDRNGNRSPVIFNAVELPEVPPQRLTR